MFILSRKQTSIPSNPTLLKQKQKQWNVRRACPTKAVVSNSRASLQPGQQRRPVLGAVLKTLIFP